MFQVIDYLRRFLAEKLDRILIVQIIARFDRVKGVPFWFILFQAS